MSDVKTAIFAAGCFWGVEDAFRKLAGVLSTRVGYLGGKTENPTYEQVCRYDTGHAEAVEVTYDPGKISYDELLQVFWSIHDPTTLNRQGPDVGSQYRSAVFYQTPDEQQKAEGLKNQLNAQKAFPKPVVTEITPATVFYQAEAYHQQYHEKQGGSCGLPNRV